MVLTTDVCMIHSLTIIDDLDFEKIYVDYCYAQSLVYSWV